MFKFMRSIFKSNSKEVTSVISEIKKSKKKYLEKVLKKYTL